MRRRFRVPAAPAMVSAPAADVSARRPRRLWSPLSQRRTRERGDLPNSNCRKIGKFVLFQRKMSCGTNVRSFSVDSSGKIWYNYVERASKPCAAPACRPVNRQRGVCPARLGSSFCTHTDAVFGRKTRRVPNQIRTFVRKAPISQERNKGKNGLQELRHRSTQAQNTARSGV